MARRLLVLCAALAGAGVAHGQLGYVHGPELAPLGAPVHLTISNDRDRPVYYDPCAFAVFDVLGEPVYAPPCEPIVELRPGETYVHTWPQVDDAGHAVLPGIYALGDPHGPAVIVGGSDAAIVPLGAPKLGTARPLALSSPLDPGFPYLLAASSSSAVGLPTCAGVVPLDPGPILALSLSRDTFLHDALGLLDATGRTTAPLLVLPPSPELAGARLVLAFVVLDPGAPCAVRRISTPLELTLQ